MSFDLIKLPSFPLSPFLPSVPGIPSLPSFPEIPSAPALPGTPSNPGSPGTPSLNKNFFNFEKKSLFFQANTFHPTQLFQEILVPLWVLLDQVYPHDHPILVVLEVLRPLDYLLSLGIQAYQVDLVDNILLSLCRILLLHRTVMIFNLFLVKTCIQK